MIQSFREWLEESLLDEDEKWFTTDNGHKMAYDTKSGKITKGLFAGGNIKNMDTLAKNAGKFAGSKDKDAIIKSINKNANKTKGQSNKDAISKDDLEKSGMKDYVQQANAGKRLGQIVSQSRAVNSTGSVSKRDSEAVKARKHREDTKKNTGVGSKTISDLARGRTSQEDAEKKMAHYINKAEEIDANQSRYGNKADNKYSQDLARKIQKKYG